MKNLTKIFVAVAALFVGFACTTDATEDLGVNLGGQTTLTISLEESRTQLGEKVDGVYSLYWSENDQISVNGVASNALAADEAGKANATFVFGGQLSHPYSVVYPATAANEVVFLASQSYNEGTFCAGAAPMYGYAESAADPIQMKHLAGALRFDVKGSATLSSLVVEAENGVIAGTYSVDCTNGALTPKEGETSNKVTLSFGEGLTLSEVATPIYVAIPAGEYGLVSVTLNSVEGEKMVVKFDTSAKAVAAGKVREFSAFEFAATASDEFVIDSKEALIAFAANPTKSAVVTANIDMTGVEWTPIEEFGAFTFDGGNFEIKGLSAPLFGTTSATIKNVKLVGVAYEESANNFSGAIARVFSGTMNNCSASGAVNINNTTFEGTKADKYADICHGGLVGFANGATITNSTNNINITITSFCKSGYSVKCTAGGICAGATNRSSFDGLTNNGNILFAATSHKGNIYISGIVGKGDDGSAEAPIIALSNCTNNGKIETAATSVTSNDVLLGGITGTMNKVDDTVVFENLTNNGAITLAGKSASSRCGGITTFNTYGSFKNCKNTANVTAASTVTATNIYASGLFSGPLYGGICSECHNTGNITVEDDVTAAGLVRVSGVADTISADTNESKMSQAIITNCSNAGKITIKGITNTTTGNNGRIYASGICNQLTAAELSQCHNLAAGVIDVKPKSMASGVMVGAIAAYVSPTGGLTDQVITITDCSNAATINVAPVAMDNNFYVGGITGQHWASKEDYNAIYTRVNNSGDINCAGGTYGTRSDHSVGGIMGYLNTEMDFDSCQNTGNITFAPTGENTGCMLGGIVGYVKARTDGTAVASASSFNKCSNSGDITCTPSTFTGSTYIGGFIGASDSGYRQVGVEIDTYTSCTTSGDIYLNGDGTMTTYFVGAFMGFLKTGSTIKNCSTSKESAVNISVKTVSTYGYSGWISHFQQAAGGDKFLLEGCTNSSTTTISSKSHTASANFSGVFGGNSQGGISLSGSATYEAKDCTFDGAFNFSGKTTNQVLYGGLCQYPYGSGNTYTISNFQNNATVNITGSCKSVVAGGLCQYISGTMIVDEKTKVNEKFTFDATASAYFCYGGYWGNINHGQATDSYKGTYSGSVTVSGSLGTNLIIGGFGSQHKAAINLDGVVFSGTIQLGTPEKSLTVNGTYFRIGGITAGGGVDYDSKNLVHTLNNVKSVGNITVENVKLAETVTTVQIGGVYGFCSSPLEGATSYCNIKALGLANPQIGMVIGTGRSETSLAKNCAVGGTICKERKFDADAYDEVDVVVTLDESNFMDYIYGTTTDWTGVADYDGCSVLTSAPKL